MRIKITFVSAALFVCAVAAFATDAPPQVTPQQQAMMEKMAKAGTPGPQHAMLAKLAGDWACTGKFQMDPSQPWQEAQSTATITTLMDGRYIQEVTSGQMMGAPFNGMGIYGFDNVSGKFVSIWIDNMGTGIMNSVGTADANGKVINWIGTMNDPMTGKAAKERMVLTIVDDDHHTLEMYGVPPGGKKEMKMMTIDYARNSSASH
jgi:uncharacterized protein YfaP (DUF2135 family)